MYAKLLYNCDTIFYAVEHWFTKGKSDLMVNTRYAMIVPSLHFVTLADFKLTVVTCSVIALFDICIYIYMLELAIVSTFLVKIEQVRCIIQRTVWQREWIQECRDIMVVVVVVQMLVCRRRRHNWVVP